MNITVTFRHVEPSSALKQRATEKIAKLQKFLRQPMTARVTVSLEKLLHQVEARISSGGERYEARETTEDMYASIDKVLDKLERQIRGNKGAARAKKRHGGDLLRAVALTGTLGPKATNGKKASSAPRAVKGPARKKQARAAK